VETFWAKKSTLRPVDNPTGRSHYNNIFILGHKQLAPGNRVRKKKGSYSFVFKLFEWKLFGLKNNMEAGRQSDREIELQNLFQTGA
jgi:hypothetical protein